jgi:TPR repeat protein
VTGRWRDGLGWGIATLVVAGVAAAAITAWLSNGDKGTTVVVALVVAAVAGVVAPQLQQVLGGIRQRRALLTRRAAGTIRGRLPRLGDISLGELGVRVPREASGQPPDQSLYARRHALDPALADAFAKHRFVLVHGPSAAGKSRSSAEVARGLWPRRLALVPYQQPGALADVMDAGIRPQTIVWLDDLDRHLDAGVDVGLMRRLLEVSGVRVIATMRASAYETLKPGQLRPPGADVIDLAHLVRFTEWDQEDRDHASSLLAGQPGQSDVVAALNRGTGLAGYLSAVPDLIERLEDGDPPAEGVAVVRVVADWYRSGLTRPVPISWARDLYPVYLPSDDVTLVTRFDDGIAWAASPVSGARLLTQPTDGSGLLIHDSVLEHLVRTLPPGLPEPTWRAVTAELTIHQNLDELTAVGVTAYRVHDDLVIAERLLRRAAEAGRPDAANNLGLLLQESGRLPEAEHWYQAAAEAGHQDAANNLGVLLQQSGRLPEAEHWYQAAAEAGHQDAANNLGVLLQQSGRLPEAERWYQAAADGGHAYAANSLQALHRQSRRIERGQASATLGRINGGLRRRVAARDIPGALAAIQQLARSAELILAEDIGMQQVANNVGQAVEVICRGGSPGQLDATAAACEQLATGTLSPLLTAMFQALRGVVLSAKFDQTGQTVYLDASVGAFEQAVAAAPEANPVRTVYAATLAKLESAQVALAEAARDDARHERARQTTIDGSGLIAQASESAAPDPSHSDHPAAD